MAQVTICAALALSLALLSLLCATSAGLGGEGLARELPWRAWAGERILLVTAHPDDAEDAAGGLVALLSTLSPPPEVAYYILTDGCHGWQRGGHPSDAYVASVRAAEAHKAAKELNATVLGFGGYTDGALADDVNHTEARRRIVSIVRAFQPHVVLHWGTAPAYDLLPSANWSDRGYHPDHQSSGKLALDGAGTLNGAGNGRVWPELGAPWRVRERYLFEYAAPLLCADLAGSSLKLKVEAYLLHKSQYAEGEAALLADNVRWVAADVARRCGLPGSAAAEGFVPFF